MESMCKFYRSGHCKFGDTCQKSHNIQTCESFPCLSENCFKRHPPICKFFLRFGRCKFGERCSYLHTCDSMKVEIKKLMKDCPDLLAQNNILKAAVLKIETLEKEIAKLKDQIVLKSGVENTEKCGGLDKKESLKTNLQFLYVNLVISHRIKD